MPIHRDGKQTTFMFNRAPGASRVFVVGDFNGWDPAANRMRRMKDGSFRARLDLEPGTYQYKFVADGSWVHDGEAERQVSDGHGGFNSLVTVS